MTRGAAIRGACAALVALAGAAGVACRRSPAPEPDAGAAAAPAVEERIFTMADLVAATRLDARVQRLIALAGEYKLALTFDRGPRLSEHTDQVAKAFGEAVPAAERALADVHDPRDRSPSERIVAAARRWPALLRAARDELVASPHPSHVAADALGALDDEVARALEAYRAFRATWRIGDSPAEPEPVLQFLRARRDLESKEAAAGRRVQGGAGPAGGPAEARADAERAIASARAACEGVDAGRRASAERYVDAEAQALRALLGLTAPDALEEQRERDALAYQIAKYGALEAIADYVALTGKPSAAPR